MIIEKFKYNYLIIYLIKDRELRERTGGFRIL